MRQLAMVVAVPVSSFHWKNHQFSRFITKQYKSNLSGLLIDVH